jgi:hypothetical protein
MEISYAIANGDEALMVEEMGDELVLISQQPSEGGPVQNIVMTYADVCELYERMKARYGAEVITLAA